MSSNLNIVRLVREAASRNERESRRSKSAHRAKFLSIKNDIEELIYKDKLPAQFVWKTLKEQDIIQCSYQTFLKYCKYYIVQKSNKTDDIFISSKQKEKMQIPIKKAQDNQPIITKSSSSTFVFNSNPDGKDLL